MKHYLIITIMFIGVSCFSQIVNPPIILKDKALIAQEKRQVFEKWGDFRPDPKYILGVQTNFHYAMVWGWLSPSRNRGYKNGADIRPLKPEGGQQILREGLAEQMRRQTRDISAKSDTIGQNALDEFFHNSAISYATDPLYLLYYRKQLKPIREWDATQFPFEIADIILSHPAITQLDLTQQQMTEILNRVYNGDAYLDYINEMDVLQERFEMATSLPMPRGKRIISYHDMMISQRNLYNKLTNGLVAVARIRGVMMKNTTYTVGEEGSSVLDDYNPEENENIFEYLVEHYQGMVI